MEDGQGPGHMPPASPVPTGNCSSPGPSTALSLLHHLALGPSPPGPPRLSYRWARRGASLPRDVVAWATGPSTSGSWIRTWCVCRERTSEMRLGGRPFAGHLGLHVHLPGILPTWALPSTWPPSLFCPHPSPVSSCNYS